MEGIKLVLSLCYAVENQVRYLTKDLDVEDYYWRSEAGSPSIGWTCGHILYSHDAVVNQSVLGNKPSIPDEYKQLFTIKSPGDFPQELTPDELFLMFKEVNSAITETMSSKTNKLLNEQPISNKGFPPNLANKNNSKILAFHFSHAFSHAGQILEIKRLMGKEAWGV